MGGIHSGTGLQPKVEGVLIVANSGEEGLGDLMGVKALMQRYGQKVNNWSPLTATSIRS